jgi:hypothetical protein
LGEDSGCNVIRGVSFNNTRLVGVEVSQDWGRAEGFLQLFECGTAFLIEQERDIFSGQSNERTCQFREVRDETSVEVGESYEGSYVPYMFRISPFFYGGNFRGVHSDTICGYDNAEI